jgi:hypothetical protein
LGFKVITNSRHLSGAEAPQQNPSLSVLGLTQVIYGLADKSTVKVGVIESQYCVWEIKGTKIHAPNNKFSARWSGVLVFIIQSLNSTFK